MKSRIFTFAFYFLFIATTVFGQEQPDKLADMDLNDLLNIEVVTASKKGEKLSDAPAIVSVVTAKEIEAFGAQSLGEVLDRMVGVYMMGSAQFPQNMLSIRGGVTELFNTQVLFLLDGRPLRESIQGGLTSTYMLAIPVSNVERIEVVRGPGSVLYGTGAYLGVINIITKKVQETNLQLTTNYGSFNSTQADLNGGAVIGDLTMSAAAHFLNSKGWDFTALGESDVVRNKANTGDSVLTTPKSANYFQKIFGASFSAAYKGLKLNSFYGRTRQEDMGRQPIWNSPVDYAYGTDHFFIDGGYSYDVSPIWTSSLNITYNKMNFRFYRPIDSYQDDITRRNSSDILFEWTNFIKPSDNINIVFGAVANSETGSALQLDMLADGSTPFNIATGVNTNPMIVVPDYSQTLYTAYAQADYTPASFIKIIAGGQMNKVPQMSADFVPRLGTILTITDQLRAKILYGKAFRSPSAFELEAQSIPSIYGNTNLRPEKIGTFETQLSYSTNNIEASVTYYNSIQTNQITRSLAADSLKIITYLGKKVSAPMYINRGELKMQGFEFEVKAVVSKELSLHGSLATQTSEDQNGKKDIYGTPKLMAKVGVEYSAPCGFNAGLYNSYFGKGGDITAFDSKGKQVTRVANPAAAAFNYLSLNLGLDITKVAKLTEMPSITLNIYGENLLDAGVYYPEYARRNINSIPGRPGRAIYAGFGVKF
ncbi:MAG: TonB-dependent receptor plug domain-containing protein [Syntrophomonadaceae bacterium]